MTFSRICSPTSTQSLLLRFPISPRFLNAFHQPRLRTPPVQSMRMSTAVRSHAKINLGLGIGAPRPDGFHSLTTVYQTLEIFDVVTVTAHPAPETTLRLSSNDPRVPTDQRNTAWKMVEIALKRLYKPASVEIHIEKQLPVQGGLGAGSANAVAALLGLEAELDVSLTSRLMSQRLEIAAKVGSDVPLFLIGGAILGLDRGQQVYPLPDFEPVWCVVAAPDARRLHRPGLPRLGRPLRRRKFDPRGQPS